MDRIYRIEVVAYGPAGIVKRLMSCETNEELATAALVGIQEMLDELAKDSEDAEPA